jgi:hypothetical protein
MAFITAQQLASAIALRMGHGDSANMPAHWVGTAEDCVESAYNAIVATLAGRRFSPAQIAAWDRGAEYNRRIGLCHAFREASLQGENVPGLMQQICAVEDELKTVPVTIDGVLVAPAGGGRITTGERPDEAFTAGQSAPLRQLTMDDTL